MNIEAIDYVDSVSKLLQVVSSGDNKPTLTLLCLYASWTRRRFKCRANTLAHIVNECLISLGIQGMNVSLKAIVLQVDKSDEMLNFCISDKCNHMNILDLNPNYVLDFNQEARNKVQINCPEELPCLVTLLHRPDKGFTKTHVTLDSRILSNFLNEIHDICDSYDSSSFEDILHVSCKEKVEWNQVRQTIQQVLSDQIHSLHKRPHMITTSRPELSLSNYSLPLRLFVAGDRSQVGKSSICLGLLGSLLQIFPASELAYIKPATQCEEPQMVSTFCAAKGIAAVPVGPLVYYRGFTRAFLNDETDSTEVLLQQISKAVDDLAKDKSVVIIDGVGYPSVGSITGTDNASVALASGYLQENGIRLPPSVLLVGRSGVGDAVDSYNLNASYFRCRNIPVLGAIFNKLSLDGYYSLENCRDAVDKYFRRNHSILGGEQVYGFIPEIKRVTQSEGELEVSKESKDGTMETDTEETFIYKFIDSFSKHINVHDMLLRASYLKQLSALEINDNEFELCSPSKKARTDQDSIQEFLTGSISRIKLSRDQIESSAKVQGAPAG